MDFLSQNAFQFKQILYNQSFHHEIQSRDVPSIKKNAYTSEESIFELFSIYRIYSAILKIKNPLIFFLQQLIKPALRNITKLRLIGFFKLVLIKELNQQFLFQFFTVQQSKYIKMRCPWILLVFYLESIVTLNLYTLKQTFVNTNGYDKKIVVSKNGSKMITANTNGTLSIFNLVGGNYTFQQAFYLSQSLMSAYITSDQSIIVTARTSSCQIYEYNASASSYQITQTIIAFSLTRAKITEDKMHLFLAGFNPVISHYVFDGLAFLYLENLSVLDSIIDIYLTPDSQSLVCGGYEQKIRIYQKIGNNFNLFKVVNTNLTIYQIYLSSDKQSVFVAGVASFSEKYVYNGSQYIYEQTLETFSSSVLTMHVIPTTIVFGGGSIISVFKQNNSVYLNYQNITYDSVVTTWLDDSGSVLAIGTSTNTYVYYLCPKTNCNVCTPILQCSVCEDSYDLVSGQCILATNQTGNISLINSTGNTSSPIVPVSNMSNISVSQESEITQIYSVCVDSIEDSQGICLQYCDQSCSSCLTDKFTCLSCPEMYQHNQNGICEIDLGLKIGGMLFSVFSILRHYKAKCLIFMVDDIWLYQYHKPEYKNFPSDVFEIARIIQSKKDEFLSPSNFQLIDDIRTTLKRYDERANKKFLELERRDDSLPTNILDFVFQVIPVTLVTFFILKLLFKQLFNYPISIYLRAFSFGGFVFVTLIQGNIEYFTFLGARSIFYIFAQFFVDKMYSIFVILFLFPIVVYTFGAYLLLNSQYTKHLKYFLDNLFRIPGSIWVMEILYCYRPFLKGIIHSMLFEFNSLQLFLLGMIDVFTFLILALLQIRKDIHKSHLSFVMLCTYLISGILLNQFLWIIVNYSNDAYIVELMDQSIEIILWVRFVCLFLSFVFKTIEVYKLRTDEFAQLDEQGQQVQIILPPEHPKSPSKQNSKKLPNRQNVQNLKTRKQKSKNKGLPKKKKQKKKDRNYLTVEEILKE